ncbi:MAG: hypothetical protein QOI46_1497 [Alphaproteobacteria bacterium]|nr:hypothetical protein [Alphaproteobacteria bacterium]
MGLMAEMNASFEELTHRKIGKRHGVFSGYAAAEPWVHPELGKPPDGHLDQDPRVRWAPYSGPGP